jgi:hypothetical protein
MTATPPEHFRRFFFRLTLGKIDPSERVSETDGPGVTTCPADSSARRFAPINEGFSFASLAGLTASSRTIIRWKSGTSRPSHFTSAINGAVEPIETPTNFDLSTFQAVY